MLNLKALAWLFGLTLAISFVGMTMDEQVCAPILLGSMLLIGSCITGRFRGNEVDGRQFIMPIVASLVSPLLALCVVDLGKLDGPSWLTVLVPAGILSAVAVAAVCTWLSLCCEPARRTTATVVVAGLCSLLCLWSASTVQNHDSATAEKVLSMCDQVKEVGLRDFDVMADSDHLITEVELIAAAKNPALSAADREVISYMLRDADGLGHRIGDHDRAGGSSLWVYSKDDFQNYPAKAHQIYSAWEHNTAGGQH